MTQNLVVGTAGHIDHGKSTLVHALTGIDPDRLKEEKARGITIELGFAHATIGDVRVAFVDVPGHEKFVRTMLAGVGGIDCVMLIVASDESVMPQTREHFDICRLLHIPRGIVVLTKADASDEDTRALVRQDVADLVKGSFLEQAPVVEVSANTGEGLDALRSAIAANAALIGRRPLDGAARLPIDRAFSIKGFGTVVTGTLVSGRIRVDDGLALLPGDRVVKVRGIQVHGTSATEAVAGQRTAINLGGVEVADISRGQTLATPKSVSVTRRVDALVDLLPSSKPLRHGARVRMHNGTSEILGRVSIAGPSATAIAPGGRALVRLRLEQPAVLTRGDRFIIRAYSPPITIGGGRVLDPAPTRPGVRSAEGAASLERLQPFDSRPSTTSAEGHSLKPGAEDELQAIASMVVAAGLAGVAAASLVSRAGVSPKQLGATIDALGRRSFVVAGDRVVDGASLTRAGQALIKIVTAFHGSHPLSEGLPREEAREKVFARSAPAIFEKVIDDLKAAKALAGTDRLALASHRVTVSGEDARVKTAVAEAYRRAGLKPPDAAAVAAEAGSPGAVVEKITALLLREKALVRLDTLIFHAEVLGQLKDDVRALKASAPDGRATVDVAAFKDRYGVTRKFAIPLLEYLDRERVTRRTGDVRLVL
ncbi:MAG: selenocysteine-specific translation elongation factor [Acidobacteriota bacterium]|nr:selenocysteine-specific translation elongation factor [Acidobacteriota bacterium]